MCRGPPLTTKGALLGLRRGLFVGRIIFSHRSPRRMSHPYTCVGERWGCDVAGRRGGSEQVGRLGFPAERHRMVRACLLDGECRSQDAKSGWRWRGARAGAIFINPASASQCLCNTIKLYN